MISSKPDAQDCNDLSEWEETTLGAVVNPTRPRISPSERPELPFIGMDHVEAHSMKLLGTVPAGAMKSAAVHFQPGDVLYGRLRPYLNKVYRATFEGLCSAEFIVIPETEELDSRYLQYFLNSSEFVSYATQLNAGDRPRVKFEQLSSYPFPLLSIDQQKRIVAEIEKQFSRLDEAVANLKRVKANLKRYKAAVLKAAVEGKLTEEWRAAQGCANVAGGQEPGATKAHPDVEPASKLLDRILAERRAKWEKAELAKMEAKGKAPKNDKWKAKYEEPTGPEVSDLPAIPDTWAWATMPQLGELNRGKSKHRPRNDPILYGGNYPFVQTGDIRHATGVLTSWTQSYSEEGLKQSRLWPEGTLCITIAANIADTAILGFDACFPDSVVGFLSESEQFDVRFLEYFIRTAKENLERFAPATAQKNINLAILEKVAVAVPPVREQRRIIEEIESRLSISESLEQALSANQSRADRLRQSILMKAFSGQMVRYS